jgi:hypothetical protein
VCFTFIVSNFQFQVSSSFDLFANLSPCPGSSSSVLKAKESKASITNEDEESVIREGQPESLESPDRGVRIFYF